MSENDLNSGGLNLGDFTRRDFLKLATGAGLYFTVEQFAGAATAGGVPYRRLGTTTEKVSMVGIGGYHLGNVNDQQTATRIVRKALDSGINFMDNCWDYHDGKSEILMGNALRDGYRQKAFLMTKIDAHSKAGAAQQIDESLKRLQTDHLDLLQFHEVIRPDDPEKIFAKNGSFEAAMEAKKAGKIRHIGFTGHKDPHIHAHMLDVAQQHGFKFDTVQMPLNVFDANFNSFRDIAMPKALKAGTGVLGMKPLSAGLAVQKGGLDAKECLRFAMSLPTSVVITGCESEKDLDQALAVVRDFKPMKEEEMASLVGRARAVSSAGQLEKYKTSHDHDGTMQNPQWLREAA